MKKLLIIAVLMIALLMVACSAQDEYETYQDLIRQVALFKYSSGAFSGNIISV